MKNAKSAKPLLEEFAKRPEFHGHASKIETNKKAGKGKQTSLASRKSGAMKHIPLLCEDNGYDVALEALAGSFKPDSNN